MSYISKKLICGVGVRGRSVAWVNGKLTKAYTTWYNMLRRCYCLKSLSKYPTYTGCSVCSEWLFFPTFEEWFDENYIEGYHLDKDLLIAENKIYGPNYCIFVSPAINVLFTDSGRTRGDYPTGVSLHKQTSKLQARLSIDGTEKHLGYFDTVEDASQAYLIAKKENVIRVANIWRDKIPIKLYEVLIRKANDLI